MLIGSDGLQLNDVRDERWGPSWRPAGVLPRFSGAGPGESPSSRSSLWWTPRESTSIWVCDSGGGVSISDPCDVLVLGTGIPLHLDVIRWLGRGGRVRGMVWWGGLRRWGGGRGQGSLGLLGSFQSGEMFIGAAFLGLRFQFHLVN